MNMFFLWILSSLMFCRRSSGLECGYPGSPAFGRPHPVKETYRPGEAVSFTCAHGYALQGPLQRVCASDGTWAGTMPLCDRSLSSVDHLASSRQTLSLYPASKAIDGDPRTCTYTDKSRPRWVRFDMRTRQRVRAVAITMPRGTYSQDPAQLTIYAIQVRDNTTASYHKCASFNGKFATNTLQLSCAGGEAEGRYIHVEDNRHRVDYFSLCEIQVFVNKGSYECGEAERPAHAYSVRTQSGAVEYRCVYGYRLEGPSTRECMQDGQWSNPQPVCREVICPLLRGVPHGRLVYSGRRGDTPVLGSTVNVSCEYGYQHQGDPLVCGLDGQWSANNITCKAVECGLPVPRHSSEEYELLNGTSYGSAALLRCGELQQTILCREDGTWTQPDIECQAHGVSNLGLVDEQSEIPTGIVIGMTIVVFLLVIAVILVLLLKRKKEKVVSQHSGADSIPSKETTPSSGGQPYENDAFYATIPAETRSSSKSPSLLSTVLFPRRHQSPSTNDSGHSSSSCIYEEIGGVKKATPPLVPPPTAAVQSEVVYASVDLEEKRRSRLVKARAPPPEEEELEPNRLLDEVDLEPIKLRELPPIPDDNGSGITYASLSLPLDPPTLCRQNDIYDTSGRGTVMKDNEVYSSNTIKL